MIFLILTKNLIFLQLIFFSKSGINEHEHILLENRCSPHKLVMAGYRSLGRDFTSLDKINQLSSP